MHTTALLSLWNGVDPARQAEYERWHTLEHVPERVWVPGFVSGTRYRNETPGQARYFTLYALQRLDCLASAAYRTLVEQPTPWSAAMRPALRDFVRKPGPLLAQAGVVLGTGLAVSRLVWPAAAAPAADHWAALCTRLMAAPGACRVRVQQVADAGPQALRNADTAPAGAEFICLVDTTEPMALAEITRRLDALLQHSPPCWHQHGHYQLICEVQHAAVQAPERPVPA